MPVGDINSNAAGSGARYNDGKPDLALIPLELIASHVRLYPNAISAPDLVGALDALGKWQFRRDVDVAMLHLALHRSGATWEQIARVFEYGRAKYAAWNWAKGMAWTVPMASATRHLLAALHGEENDAESGLPHVGHFGCNMIMLLHYASYYHAGDDRPGSPPRPDPAMNAYQPNRVVPVGPPAPPPPSFLSAFRPVGGWK